ncbi:MAG: HAMP domain-containing sensor histidine kinase [Armatimonas sp.]
MREQFYAAAAHELRTPLAVISASIEVVLSRPRTSDEYQETLTDLGGQFQRLTRLTEDLLTLNRLNLTEQGVEESEEVDLADICQRVLELQTPRIAEQKLTISPSFAEAVEIRAPLSHAFAVVRNVIENAVRYTPAGGQISVSLTQVANSVKLVVCNDFHPDSTINCQRWFEPFYREDASRSSATGGNGLGLTISRRIAEVNGWPFTLTYTDNTVRAELLFTA